jgi:hypothetical protein
VNIIIRQIGHRLLLQAGDSTSRVLPVTEIKEGTFLLKFENEFIFNHDSLIVLSQSLLPKIQFPSGYTVTVYDCKKGDIAYGFQLNNTSPDILACIGRIQPPGCYALEFDFPDLYASIGQKKTDIDQLTASAKVDPQKVNSTPITIGTEELKISALDNNIDQLTALNKFDTQEVNSKPGALKMPTLGYLLINAVCGLILVLGVILLMRRFGKISKQVSVQNQEQYIINESVPESAALGKFLFDVKGQHLLLGSEVISLTDKECQVLELLHKNFGELIPRETLMQKVWIDEGVITGRSLDMFISKLRKILSADPDLRITNIHGKGYRLEIVSGG